MRPYKDFYGGKEALITGGMGFIGSTLAHRLVELGSDVTLVDSLIPEYGGNLFNISGIKDRVNINFSDVRDRHSMGYLVKGKDLLFNLAGTLSHIDSMQDPFTDLEINCAAQLSILEVCRRNNPDIKIVFAATRSQYGKPERLPVDEKHPMIPTDVNGINNIAGEAYHILYDRVYGIRSSSLRLTNTYGPRHQMKHPRQGIINWFIRKIIDGEEINIYGDGRQVRDINYVDDVVEALLLTMADDRTCGEVFNLGGAPVSLKDIVEFMIDFNGKGSYRLVPYPEESKTIEIGDYVAKYDKIKSLLGWEPKVGLEEGIRRTFEYYREHKKYYW